MAYSKDPEGNVDSIEFYEEGIVGDTQLKTANSQLICAPFNTPYTIWWPSISGKKRDTAIRVARDWGLSEEGALHPGQGDVTPPRYIPYDPPFASGEEGPAYYLEVNWLRTEYTNTDRKGRPITWK